MKVIGGPCGQPIRFPNSKVKRGWSYTGVKWRFETGERLPGSVLCQGARYELRYEAGVPFYVHAETAPDATLPAIRLAVGRQQFWLRRWPQL